MGAEGETSLSHSTLQRKQIRYPLLCQRASLIFIDRGPVPDVSIGCGPVLCREGETPLPLLFFFFGVFSSKHTGFNSKRCLLIRRILVTEKGTAVKLGHLLDAGHTLSSVGVPVPKKHAATIYHMSLAKRLPGINFCLLKKEELRSILQVKSRNPGPLPYGQGVGHKIRWHCKAAGGVWTLRFPRKCPGFEK